MSLFPFMSKPIEARNEPLKQQIPREYEIDFGTGQLTGRIVEGKEAIKMWVYKALKTDRYKHLIYSWDHGVEFQDLIGKGFDNAYIESEVQRYVKEALSVNKHIKEVKDFIVTFKGSSLTVYFTIITDFGEVNIRENTNI